MELLRRSKNLLKKLIVILTVAIFLIGFLIANFVTIIDPYFHYHAPLPFLQYPIDNQRYQNDGISKHFDYNAIITGTSMTENFKASEFDELFDVNSIKIAYSGGSYKEINDALKRAIKCNDEIKIVLRGLDYLNLDAEKDIMRFDSYPDYLYDDNLLNDTQYIFDKKMFEKSYDIIKYTLEGNKTTDFDKYSNWMGNYVFGKEAVLKEYQRPVMVAKQNTLTSEMRATVRENIAQNITSLAKANPDITFYMFFTPYSICFWDYTVRTGNLLYRLEVEKLAIETLLECDNIKLFSFALATDMITDFDNYKDYLHYGENVNSEILQLMKNGQYQLTKENYIEHIENEKVFFSKYDYDSIFE